MKLLLDAVLVFLVMLASAALMAWIDPGDTYVPGTGTGPGLAEASLPGLLGLR